MLLSVYTLGRKHPVLPIAREWTWRKSRDLVDQRQDHIKLDAFSSAHGISASISESLKDESHYGYNIPQNITFKFAEFKKKRDAVIKDLNDSYERNWRRENIELIQGAATFKGKNELYVVLQDGSKAVYSASHIVIATGGYSARPKDISGAEYGITSDGFFDIEKLLKKIAFVSAGYIAVELAGS